MMDNAISQYVQSVLCINVDKKTKTNDARMCGDMEWGYVGFITITDIRIKTGTTIT